MEKFPVSKRGHYSHRVWRRLFSYSFVNSREIRLDIHVLNHEGNVADCAGVAGLAALAHFKRPDVTLEGDVVTVSNE